MAARFRFLFLHSATGGGHRRAAEAVAAALTSRHEDEVEVELLDVIATHAPWPFCRTPDWYGKMLWGKGRPYGLLFRLSNRRERIEALYRLFWPLFSAPVQRLLTERSADVIAAFHPGPVQPLSRVLSSTNSPIPLVGVGTDLIVMHALWAAPGVQRYLVPTESAQEQLVRQGIDPARVKVTGLPVGRDFLEIREADPRAVRSQLGLDPERPLVLVMAGGAGLASLAGVVHALSRALSQAKMIEAADSPAQIAVLVGRNEEMRNRLKEASWPCLVHVEGFTHAVHRWMRAADLLVTKAGPNTIAEALVVGVPLVLWSAIPAQETPNVRLVTEAGAGVWTPRPSQTAEAAVRLLHDRDARVRMRERAQSLSCPEAADRIAQSLWRIALDAAGNARR